MSLKLVVLFWATLLNVIAFAMTMLTLQFWGPDCGASTLEVGGVLGSFYLAQVLFAPTLGVMLDKWGRRPVLITGLCISVVSMSVLASAQTLGEATHTPAYWWLFVARMIDGLSGGNITAARAYVADSTNQGERAQGMALIGMAFGFAFIIGAYIVGKLSVIELNYPLWAGAGCCFAALVVVLVFLRESNEEFETQESPIAALKNMWARPVLRQMLIMSFINQLAVTAFYVTIGLFAAEKFNYGAAQSGVLVGNFGIINTISFTPLVVGRVVRKLGENKTLVLGMVMAGVSFAASGMCTTIEWFFPVLAPAWVAIALSYSSLLSLLTRSAGPEEQGRISGGASFAESWGRAIAPIWGYLVMVNWGGSAVYWIVGIMMVGLGIYASVKPIPLEPVPVKGAAGLPSAEPA